MKWTVLWHPDAEEALTLLWVDAPDKTAITSSANRIDSQLRIAPLNVGESRIEDDRVYFEKPLGVLYIVDPNDRKVTVLRVWRIGER